MSNPLSNPERRAYDVLSELLSHPDLNYDEFTKGFILRHLVDLVAYGILLQYKIENKIEKVGQNEDSVDLLQLEAYGLIPYYKNTYMVHVTISFTKYYPYVSPKVCVNCTDDAIIQVSNCVDSSGAVSHDYLDSWKCHESNVVLLIKKLGEEFTRRSPLAIPNLCGGLTLDQTKLAKILIENGGKELFDSFVSLDTSIQKKIFTKITGKYRRHHDLASYIKKNESRIEAFIKNAKDVASMYVDVASSSGSGTQGSHQAGEMSALHFDPVLPHQAMLDPKVERDISNQQLKEVIKEHILSLHRYYREKDGVKCDFSKPLIEVVVNIRFCHKGVSTYLASVTICLPKDYPASCPLVWLDTPPNSVIKENLVSVGTGGFVFFTYLRKWDAKKSVLVGLVSHLSAELTCQSPFAHCALGRR